MASISVTYSFSNSTAADADQVNQNFTDIINGTSDGTKDLSVNAITAAGTLTANGDVNLGNAVTDSITFIGRPDSDIIPIADSTHDLGSTSLRWAECWADTITGTTANVDDFVASLGAVGTPSHTFTGDLDTGMYSSGADKLDLAAGGVRHISMLGGFVGLGPVSGTVGSWPFAPCDVSVTASATPGDPGLRISNSSNVTSIYFNFRMDSTDSDLILEANKAGLRTLMHFDRSDGHVGVGLSPACQLDVDAIARVKLGTVASPSSGEGLEIRYGATNTCQIYSYDRTGGAYKALGLGRGGDSIYIDENGLVGIGGSPFGSDHVLSMDGGSGTKRCVLESDLTASSGQSTLISVRDTGNTKAQLQCTKNGAAAVGAVGMWDASSSDHYYWSSNGSDVSSANAGDLIYSASANQIGTSTGTIVGTQSSDERIKEDIRVCPYGLEEIKALKPIQYELEGKTEIGFGAQTTMKIIPESVYDTNIDIDGSSNTKLAMKYERIIAPLVVAIQELAAKVEALESK